MNICLLNDSFPPVIDGVVNVVQNYAKYLMQDHAANVAVGTPGYPETDYSVYPYPVIPYQSFDTGSVTSGYRAGNPFSARAVNEIASFRPEIIHSHCPASATVVARLLRDKTQAPIVFTYHTKYDIDIKRFLRVKPLVQEGIHLMVSNIGACDEVWVVSRGAGENLRSLGFSGEYRVMPNGVDFARGRVSREKVAEVTGEYDLPEGVPVFLFVGRMMTYKGLPMILDALKILSDQGQDFRMVFVGKGPDQELLEKKAEELGLMDRKCIFTGPVYDREALRAWNTRADLFLFPSTFDTNGLVVREASACGLASVLIEGSCAAEGITDGRNGYTIEENAEAMAAALETLCKDLDAVHQVGLRAMDEIYLSWETCVDQAFGRYEEILGRWPENKAERKKAATDYLVSLTAKGMTEYEKIRHAGREVFDDFRQGASGMMENMQDAITEAERMRDRSRQRAENMRNRAEETAKHLKEHMAEEKARLLGEDQDSK